MAWEVKEWKGIQGSGLDEFNIDGVSKTVSAQIKEDGTPFTAEAINDLESRVGTAINNNEAMVTKEWHESVVADDKGDYSIILDGVDAKMHLTFTGASRGMTAEKMNEIEEWLASFVGKTTVAEPPVMPTPAVIKTVKINGVKVTMSYAPTTVTQEGDNLLEAITDLIERLTTNDESDVLLTVTDGETPVTSQDVIIKKNDETVSQATTDGEGHADFIDLTAGTYVVSYPDGTHPQTVDVHFQETKEVTIDISEEND